MDSHLLELFRAAGTTLHEPVYLFGSEANGKVYGGFALTDWSGDTIQMHFVGERGRWLSRALLRRVFSFCFQQLNTKVILGFLPSDRLHAVHVAKKLGFKEFGPGPIPAVGIHMLTMVREDCRWLDLPSRGGNG